MWHKWSNLHENIECTLKIYGKTIEEHDKNLRKTMAIPTRYGLVSNMTYGKSDRNK